MAVSVIINSNAKQVQKKLDRFFNKFPGITRKGLAQASFQLQAIIKELTDKGLDINRRRFAPYSEGYISRLQREGKSTRVDLKYSNDMMNSLTGKVQSNKKAIVFFNRGEMRERALFNQFLNSPRREFFGFSKRTEKIIQKQFVKFMEKEIRKFKI